jgi:hypothetical protein
MKRKHRADAELKRLRERMTKAEKVADGEIKRLRERVAKSEKTALKRKEQRDESVVEVDAKTREVAERVRDLKRAAEQVCVCVYLCVCVFVCVCVRLHVCVMWILKQERSMRGLGT